VAQLFIISTIDGLLNQSIDFKAEVMHSSILILIWMVDVMLVSNKKQSFYPQNHTCR